MSDCVASGVTVWCLCGSLLWLSLCGCCHGYHSVGCVCVCVCVVVAVLLWPPLSGRVTAVSDCVAVSVSVWLFAYDYHCVAALMCSF